MSTKTETETRQPSSAEEADMPAAYSPRRTPPADLGPLLQTARLRAGLGMRETARVAGISHGYLVKLEAGTRVPSRTVAGQLADLLALDDAERARLYEIAVQDAGRDWRGWDAV